MDIKEGKEKLRNALFEKYFEVKDNYIKFEDLMNKMIPITDSWQYLSNILVENSKDFDNYRKLEMLKEINYNRKDYLIIKKMFWKYLIIDLNEKRALLEEEITDEFKEDIFINNFKEEKESEGFNYYPKMYEFLEYSGDIESLLELYNEKKDILNIYPRIYYRINIGKAWTATIIDLSGYDVQLHFQTPNQFLYEHLFFEGDLNPSRMQDAIKIIGLEKIEEMFKRTKEIPIPISVIPKEYLPYILTKAEKEKSLVKKFEVNN